MKTLVMAGSFDDNGGKPSSYIAKLFSFYPHKDELKLINGGYYSELIGVTFGIIEEYSHIYWFADIPNEYKSRGNFVNEIKVYNPKCMLVTSKRNDGGKYPYMDLIGRALKTKSNLLIEFRKLGNPSLVSSIKPQIGATVLDPLGNAFCFQETDIEKVAGVLFSRVDVLSGFRRVRSVRVGDAVEVPDEGLFFQLAIKYAETFHQLVHANTDRFLGNLSFRCERGFPSFRAGKLIFVSRRNIDKRHIDRNGFVGVEPQSDEVRYYGDHKPSVDTPVQLRLYEHYKNVNYMLHSHTYIKDAPFTHSTVPCGAIEEFDEIIALQPDRELGKFAINLKGHGSLMFGAEAMDFQELPYYARGFPEMS